MQYINVTIELLKAYSSSKSMKELLAVAIWIKMQHSNSVMWNVTEYKLRKGLHICKPKAERIIQANALGYSPQEIYEVENFQSTKVSASTIRNFIKRFEDDEVVFEDKRQTIQEEVTELHNRVRLLEDWKDKFELNWLGKLLFRGK